ncbi:hypothetical protein RCL1_000538 [Eukaryota sp. TZLM3-RCL]
MDLQASFLLEASKLAPLLRSQLIAFKHRDNFRSAVSLDFYTSQTDLSLNISDFEQTSNNTPIITSHPDTEHLISDSPQFQSQDINVVENIVSSANLSDSSTEEDKEEVVSRRRHFIISEEESSSDGYDSDSSANDIEQEEEEDEEAVVSISEQATPMEPITNTDPQSNDVIVDVADDDVTDLISTNAFTFMMSQSQVQEEPSDDENIWAKFLDEEAEISGDEKLHDEEEQGPDGTLEELIDKRKNLKNLSIGEVANINRKLNEEQQSKMIAQAKARQAEVEEHLKRREVERRRKARLRRQAKAGVVEPLRGSLPAAFQMAVNAIDEED